MDVYFSSSNCYILGPLYQRPLPLLLIRCDDLDVVNTVNQTRNHPEVPIETLKPRRDLLEDTRTAFRLHPVLSLFHVKGQHDNALETSEHPRQPQLNIQTDLLAATFQATTNHATDGGRRTVYRELFEN
jgi:hypothetical protein